MHDKVTAFRKVAKVVLHVINIHLAIIVTHIYVYSTSLLYILILMYEEGLMGFT